MRNIILFSYILLISSCAKLGWVIDQGVGQIKLLNKAEKNEKLLKDPTVSQTHKDKIKLIQTYKNYFYKYFDKPETDIYSKTTILESDAVTHLIVASPYNEIKALKHCFTFMGCFPYLGFFDEKEALKFKKELEREEYYTYKRPVYAYSTLGYFTDPILSSFFGYNDYELAELIFHELFHTILFIKSEVKFNENLANYFGQELAKEYFKDNVEMSEKHIQKIKRQDTVKRKLVALVNSYKEKLETIPPKSKADADKMLKDFQKNFMKPELLKVCKELGVKECKAANREWNNARMSAYLTYESKQEKFKKLREKFGFSIKDYFEFIKKEYKEYEGDQFGLDLFSKHSI